LSHTLSKKPSQLSASNIIDLFNHTFEQDFNTVLQGEADEPFYAPAVDNDAAKVLFRDDYVSSAMHEISHWTIAGNARRLLEDYGYWYETDGRNPVQQKAFEGVEVRPQAVELLLHYAADLPFRVSVDNLSLPEYDTSVFERKVADQVSCFFDPNKADNVPVRAMCFIKALVCHRGLVFQSDQALYQWLALSVSD
jgi:elongation factor P hydroxylase